jgi:hypothetical protein
MDVFIGAIAAAWSYQDILSFFSTKTDAAQDIVVLGTLARVAFTVAIGHFEYTV